jgi:ABC-type arginine/histidine transport system permease subunit
MGIHEDISIFEEIMRAVERFLVIFIGSIVIGAVIALIVAFIQKR